VAFKHSFVSKSAFWQSCRTHATAADNDRRNSSSTSLGDATSKADVPKCTNPSATPHSQAIAIMLSKDQMPAEQLRSSMDALSQQLLQNIGSYSSTELSAFTEACRCGFVHSRDREASDQRIVYISCTWEHQPLPQLSCVSAHNGRPPRGATVAGVCV
jgi:hypothetical protein